MLSRHPSIFSSSKRHKQKPDDVLVSGSFTALELQYKGTAFAREGKLEDARIALARSLVKDLKNPGTLNNMGLVMRRLIKNTAFWHLRRLILKR